MRRAAIVEPLIWMGVGLFFTIFGFRLNVGTLNDPAPGFLPVVMGVLLIFCASVLLGRILLSPPGGLKPILWKRPAWMIGFSAGYGFWIDLLGFPLSTFFLMFLCFGLLYGKNRWQRSLIYAVVCASGAWLIFGWAMNIPFPTSTLWNSWR